MAPTVHPAFFTDTLDTIRAAPGTMGWIGVGILGLGLLLLIFRWAREFTKAKHRQRKQ